MRNLDHLETHEDDTDLAGETENEPELPELSSSDGLQPAIRQSRSDSSYSNPSLSTTPTDSMAFSMLPKRNYSKKLKNISMHDLTHRFFRKPVVVLWRLDLFR